MVERIAPTKIGRRERKRRETHAALATAAVDLAYEVGFDSVTIEAICDRADVSRTTFFNYFPSRDEAILGSPLGEAPPEFVAERFADFAGDPVACVLALSVPALRVGTSGTGLGPRRTGLIAHSANALRRYSATLVGAQAALVNMTRVWLEHHQEHARLAGRAQREADLAVMVAYASMYACTAGWMRPISAVPDDQIFEREPQRMREILAQASAAAAPALSSFMPKVPASTEVVGHRERKRRATELRIQQNAVSLAQTVGFEAVTIEAICEGADVSRSTFFNYFPSRESAILGFPIEIVDDVAATAIVATCDGDLIFATLAMIVASLGPSRIGSPLAQQRAELAVAQPAAAHAAMVMLVDAGTALIETIGRALQADAAGPSEQERAAGDAALAANAAYALLAVVEGGWLSVAGDLDTSEPTLRQAMDDLRTVTG